MLKTLRDMMIGAVFALVASFAGVSMAQVGTPPGAGQGLVDGGWLYGVTGGRNYSYVFNVTATASGTQANAYQLPSGLALMQVDTVATNGDSVALPHCFQGTQFSLRNAGAATLSVYGRVAVNPTTNAADTINGTAGSTAYSMTTQQTAIFFCARNGSWSALKTG